MALYLVELVFCHMYIYMSCLSVGGFNGQKASLDIYRIHHDLTQAHF